MSFTPFCCCDKQKEMKRKEEKKEKKKQQKFFFQVKKSTKFNERNSVLVKLKQLIDKQQTTLHYYEYDEEKSRPCECAFKEEEHKETRRIKNVHARALTGRTFRL